MLQEMGKMSSREHTDRPARWVLCAFAKCFLINSVRSKHRTRIRHVIARHVSSHSIIITASRVVVKPRNQTYRRSAWKSGTRRRWRELNANGEKVRSIWPGYLSVWAVPRVHFISTFVFVCVHFTIILLRVEVTKAVVSFCISGEMCK